MRTIAVLATTALLALAGCGGDDSKDNGSSSTGTSTDRGYADEAGTVKTVMQDYFAALASGDGAKACGFFTADAVKKIEAAGAKCADTVTSGVQSTGKEAYTDPTIDTPKVTGDTATVHYSLKVQGKTVDATQDLTKVDGDWKLEAATGATG